ncbi:MAG: 16S rRNA (cytidine(1402)-2'-O)-methyltransferase [Polyangiaceae bacterium]|nr:16S rRNA (cytidine(1402)-2'-O)-methyltransferase [Polyangiaceae bacterium]
MTTLDPGTLYLVPTPIGNLRDITLRACDVLRDAHHIVAEDTRRTKALLVHLGFDASRLSRLDAHAPQAALERVVAWLREGHAVALVTDAGTPTVSDPGTALVRLVVQHQLRLTALPGPSAVPVAVCASGLVDGPFFFAAFLPRDRHDRVRAVADLARRAEPCVLFEAPHRMLETLRELADAMPTRTASVARELTKVHEEIIRGHLHTLANDTREWLGEITIVLGPWDVPSEQTIADEAVDARIDEELRRGLHTRTVAERVAAWSGRPKRDVYARVIERKP